MNEKIFIYRAYYLTDEEPDLSFVPMMTRRKLSKLSKMALSAFYKCFEGADVNLVFASQYGEWEKLTKLIEQHTKENEVSPLAFSSSVHNAAVGAFSLLNNIKNKYNAVSAGENTISNGFLDALLEDSTTLFCYVDTLPKSRGFSCLAGRERRNNADLVELVSGENDCKEDECDCMIRFLSKQTNEFRAPVYTLRRIDG